jgi:AcrR family transcriptional regulator
VAAPVTSLDRRQRRRQESIEEILDVALDLMAEHGIGGLSLGEVARQLGIRPPSLYVYFESKHALYDGVFGRGARDLVDTMTATNEEVLQRATSLDEVLLGIASTLVRWAVENPVYSQLLFWRPVPGFEPSPDSYLPAVELIDRGRDAFVELQQRGWLRDDVPADQILRDWTIVTAGVVSQQLSNAPHESFAAGRFTTALPSIVEMFARQYAASPSPTRKSSSAPTRRGRREHKG